MVCNVVFAHVNGCVVVSIVVCDLLSVVCGCVCDSVWPHVVVYMVMYSGVRVVGSRYLCVVFCFDTCVVVSCAVVRSCVFVC